MGTVVGDDGINNETNRHGRKRRRHITGLTSERLGTVVHSNAELRFQPRRSELASHTSEVLSEYGAVSIPELTHAKDRQGAPLREFEEQSCIYFVATARQK